MLSKIDLVTENDCRWALRWARLLVNAYTPSGFWTWLEVHHPQFHEKLTNEFVDRVNNAWGTPDFKETIRDFLLSMSVAIPLFELHSKGNQE